MKAQANKKKAEEEGVAAETAATGPESEDPHDAQRNSDNNLANQQRDTGPPVLEERRIGGTENLDMPPSDNHHFTGTMAQQSASGFHAVGEVPQGGPAISSSENIELHTVDGSASAFDITLPPQAENDWPWYVSNRSVWELGQGKTFFGIVLFLLLTSTTGLIFFAVSLEGFVPLGLYPGTFFLPFVCAVLAYYELVATYAAGIVSLSAFRKERSRVLAGERARIEAGAAV
jgi:hypothetical protein